MKLYTYKNSVVTLVSSRGFALRKFKISFHTSLFIQYITTDEPTASGQTFCGHHFHSLVLFAAYVEIVCLFIWRSFLPQSIKYLILFYFMKLYISYFCLNRRPYNNSFTVIFIIETENSWCLSINVLGVLGKTC